MISKYDIGDKVILVGTISSISQTQNGTVAYKLKECEQSVTEENIIAKIEPPWDIRKFYTDD